MGEHSRGRFAPTLRREKINIEDKIKRRQDKGKKHAKNKTRLDLIIQCKKQNKDRKETIETKRGKSTEQQNKRDFVDTKYFSPFWGS